MTTDERVKLAREKISRIMLSLRTLLQLRAVNQIALYSDELSKQVGTSYAANAFNVLTGALFESELVRVCAIWDPARNEREAHDRDSIPAIGWLICTNEVAAVLVADIEQAELNQRIEWVGNEPPSDSIKAYLRKGQEVRAKAEGERARHRLLDVIGKISETEKSDLHNSLRNHRDKHVAHALVETTAERKGKVATPKYGYEAKLFDLSIEIVSDLLFVLDNRSFHWKSATEQTARCAKALLGACELKISE